jgi:hypothetical protein
MIREMAATGATGYASDLKRGLAIGGQNNYERRKYREKIGSIIASR